jgi:hypothetical protein
MIMSRHSMTHFEIQNFLKKMHQGYWWKYYIYIYIYIYIYNGISSIINFAKLFFAQYFDNTCFSIHNMHPIRQNHQLNSKLATAISIRFCPNYLKLIAEFLER